MKVAAVQMEAALANVDENVQRAKELADEAFSEGCKMVILPEFFTSAVAFHRDMSEVSRPLEGTVLDMMLETAQENGGYLGGSFIASREGDNYNTFCLLYTSPEPTRLGMIS